MERLRFITSLIGCLQASTRRRQARKALVRSQVIPSGGSSVIAALISLCHGMAIPVRMYARGVLAGLSGSYGNLLRKRGGRRCNAEQAAPGSGGKKAAPSLSEMLASGRFRLCGAAICFFGLILQSGFRAWERQSGHLQNRRAFRMCLSLLPAGENIGTSRDGRHVRHRFGGQPCSIGHCNPSRRLFALEAA